MEMLITMSLSVIAIGIAYLSYNYIFSSFVNYQNNNTLIKQYTNLYRFTNSLVQNAKIMKKEERAVKLVSSDGSETKVVMLGTNVLLTPPESDADTFKVELQSADFYFGDQKIEQNGNITKFVLNAEFNKQPFIMSFEKVYDAETLMELDSLQKIYSRD